MDPSEESPLSLWMVRAAELFPKSALEKEDDALSVPFNERMTKNFFQALHNFHIFTFAFVFSGRRECEVSRSMGTRHSCYFKLPIVHPALDKTIRSFDPDKAD